MNTSDNPRIKLMLWMNKIKSKRINNDWYIETKDIILKMNKLNDWYNDNNNALTLIIRLSPYFWCKC